MMYMMYLNYCYGDCWLCRFLVAIDLYVIRYLHSPSLIPLPVAVHCLGAFHSFFKLLCLFATGLESDVLFFVIFMYFCFSLRDI